MSFREKIANQWKTDRSNAFFSEDLVEKIELLNNLYKEVNRREKIYLLAQQALLDNRTMPDKTIADETPIGYCPPEKRRKLVEALEQILEIVK